MSLLHEAAEACEIASRQRGRCDSDSLELSYHVPAAAPQNFRRVSRHKLGPVLLQQLGTDIPEGSNSWNEGLEHGKPGFRFLSPAGEGGGRLVMRGAGVRDYQAAFGHWQGLVGERSAINEQRVAGSAVGDDVLVHNAAGRAEPMLGIAGALGQFERLERQVV